MLNVSIVLPIRNASRTLPACLAALERLEPPPMEIILVDNGSIDESLSLMRRFAHAHHSKRGKILEEQRRGGSPGSKTRGPAPGGGGGAFPAPCFAPPSSWALPPLPPSS